MRWFFAGLLLMIFSLALAAEGLLIPENNPMPIYPKVLSRAGVEGEVRVSFIVKADGSVSGINIVQSAHPELAEVVKDAVTQWRFKPWTVAGERPAEQSVVAPIVFRLDLDQPIDINQWLKSVKCHVINGGFRNMPEHALVDAKVFDYTRAYISNVIHKSQLAYEQRLAIIAEMNRRVPMIVRGCRENPMRRYMSFLPGEVRDLL
ncbi:energy transducer TonB [Pseudomonas sp. TH49]|jgi:protein TonB|uniref:energy transducer TonB n=1 Tax=unclassified Pseudomonas TaxID=196821 RepID=UPI000CD4FD09|nr:MULTISPECIES: energy transducer TonB [unclassified Pseudomonas]MBK5341413.1 energy transducer TonB [Pseudomonas sp. TH49]RBC02594.1 energy transducer TonB [Pseudomonas sp. MWU12-2115]